MVIYYAMCDVSYKKKFGIRIKNQIYEFKIVLNKFQIELDQQYQDRHKL